MKKAVKAYGSNGGAGGNAKKIRIGRANVTRTILRPIKIRISVTVCRKRLSALEIIPPMLDFWCQHSEFRCAQKTHFKFGIRDHVSNLQMPPWRDHKSRLLREARYLASKLSGRAWSIACSLVISCCCL